jgi:hypothetical protein
MRDVKEGIGKADCHPSRPCMNVQRLKGQGNLQLGVVYSVCIDDFVDISALHARHN